MTNNDSRPEPAYIAKLKAKKDKKVRALVAKNKAKNQEKK